MAVCLCIVRSRIFGGDMGLDYLDVRSGDNHCADFIVWCLQGCELNVGLHVEVHSTAKFIPHRAMSYALSKKCTSHLVWYPDPICNAVVLPCT